MVYTNHARRNNPHRVNPVALGVIGLLLMHAASASASPADMPHVRSSDSAILAALHEGVQRSSTFAQLVEAINQSDGIVYIEFGYCAFGRLNGCLLPFIAPAQHLRYLRVAVTPDRAQRNHDQLLALIAHEMRHALEVLEHPDVTDLAAIDAMYRTIGTPLPGRHGGFETSAARAVGDAVLNELSSARTADPAAAARSGAPQR
jgi:hypothetical protein